MILLKFFCQLTLREKKHDQVFFSHLREFLSLNPKDQFGNTMLPQHVNQLFSRLRFIRRFKHPLIQMFHLPCTYSMRMILDYRPGLVDVANNNGDTTLHLTTRFKSEVEQVHILIDMLQVLHGKGAHHDYVNNEGKTGPLMKLKPKWQNAFFLTRAE